MTVDQKARDAHARGLVDEWLTGQGAKIAQARGEIIGKTCKWEAASIAGRRAVNERAPIILTTDQIQKCEDRVVSQEWARFYGKIPANEERWKEQTAKARAALYQGKRLADIEPAPSRFADLDDELPTAPA